MPRLLMVSRTPSLAMGLAGTPFDVAVLSADEAVRQETRPQADAVLVDVQSADWAVHLLQQLRDPERPIPALVLAGPDWDRESIEEQPATSVVVRPVSQNSLVAALHGILAPPAPPTTAEPAPVASTPGGSVATEGVPLDEGNAPALPTTESVPTDKARRAAEPPRQKPAEAPPRRRREMEPLDLVRLLLPNAGTLPWVPETSQVVLGQAFTLCRADAGALLLKDGDHWEVTAGAGLRPLEFRVQLTAEHWLVETVCAGERGLLVMDTDIARSHLAGAPLASWRHLLAVPVPSVEGILTLARADDPPFSDSDLTRVNGLVREAGTALEQAVLVRELARAMVRYLGPESASG